MPRTRGRIAWYFASRLADGLRIILGLKSTPPFIPKVIASCKSQCQSSKDSCRKLSRSFPGKRTPRETIQLKEVIERSSMVLEGIRQLVAYQVTYNPIRQTLRNPYYYPRRKEVPDEVDAYSEPEPRRASNHPLKARKHFERPSIKADITIPERRLNQLAKESRVPSSRIGRISSFGSLVAGLGIGSIAEASKRTLGLSDRNNKPVFLSESNVNRIVETLCKVRGAALKLGQLISIQDESIVSPEVAAAFERVRQSADFMPTSQMKSVLEKELTADYMKSHFEFFDEKPFAAASIGQVHEARLKDGTSVAVKIQYPGVAEGIESDIKNLLMILKVWNVLPQGMFIDNLAKTARRELSWECDYEREAECQQKYANWIDTFKDSYRIRVPRVYPKLSTKKVLVTELISGVPLDTLFNGSNDVPQEVRNSIAERLLRLTLQEIFDFNFMQTDPNFSNYFYNPSQDVIYLLDFGAAREFPYSFTDTYFNLIEAAADQDYDKIVKYSREIGFLTGFESQIMEKTHAEAVKILGEAFAPNQTNYDFGRQSTTKKIASLIPTMVHHRLTPPPEETYSLHRKMSGMFLVCSKLKANIDCRTIFLEVADKYHQERQRRL